MDVHLYILQYECLDVWLYCNKKNKSNKKSGIWHQTLEKNIPYWTGYKLGGFLKNWHPLLMAKHFLNIEFM